MGFRASELELRLLLWPVFESADPLFLKEDPLMLELGLLLVPVFEPNDPLFLKEDPLILELGLLLLPVFEPKDPLFLKEDSLMLFDVLLDEEISGLREYGFLLDEPRGFDLAGTEFGLLDGRGGGIRARAEICLYERS